MTDQQTIKNSEDALRKMMHLLEAYEELHQLLPEETCHRLLGYINEDFKNAVPHIIRAITQKSDQSIMAVAK